MPLTIYNPTPVQTAGSAIVADAPAIADIDAPTLAELGASTAFQCATEAFGVSTSVSKGTRKMLCNRVAQQKVNNREYQMEALTIMRGDPQVANALLDSMIEDSTHCFWQRPGISHELPLAVGQKVQIIQVTIDAADPRPLSNEDGQEYADLISVSVVARSKLVEIVA